MTLRTVIQAVRDGLLSVGYPAQCRLCGSPVESWDDGVVCHECWTDPSVTSTFEHTEVCNRCGNPLYFPEGASPERPLQLECPFDRERLCGLCANLSSKASRSSGLYKGALEASILFLKTTPHLCPRLKRIIVQTVDKNAEVLKADLVVPIPLHPSRLRERGFNQADLISGVVSKALSVPVAKGILARARQTRRHRAGMDPVDRGRSVERAFHVERPAQIKGRSVLLVDDVYTTGATIGEAARSLLDAGASGITCFTIARVVPRLRPPASTGFSADFQNQARPGTARF
ncbi:MAG TPA: phosphoribosyltransferase family protein [Blastocatellia bacterium]|nr:phosphoribosyltransferase family protein [Blastocatellia bacterium]